jgi:hypothetical protein
MKYLIIYLIPISLYAFTAQDQSRHLLELNSHLLEHKNNAPPEKVKENKFQLKLDISTIPEMDNAVGSKVEKIETAPLLLKPTFKYIHKSGFYGGLIFVPGLTINKIESNLFSYSAGYMHAIWDTFTYRLNYAKSHSNVVGPITEENAKDEYEADNESYDVSIGYNFTNFIPYIGVGYGKVISSIKAGDGAIIRTRKDYSLKYLGLNYKYDKDLSYNFEQHFYNSDFQNFTMSIIYAF